MECAVLRDLVQRQEAAIKGKRILITGAAGTIGNVLCDRLLTLNPGVVRLLDHDEERAFYLDLKHRGNPRVRVLLGDIRDRDRMQRAIQDIDIVFHTAALKHVGLGEYNPFEVVRTNLVAIQSLIECAIDANIEKFVFTSSDKAVNPTNVMGGSKFIGERLITAANIYRGRKRTIFSSTRFGNVLGSAGSVVPIFQKQIFSKTDSRGQFHHDYASRYDALLYDET
jgi:UDP-N-acetylglucosamine 4,6-dehydratase/5-epimerase